VKRLATVLIAAALLAGTTGCATKSDEWEQNKANCLKMWGDYKSPEEMDAKCTKDADYWEKNGLPKPWPTEFVADRSK
jgi:hypothetical protein